MKKGIYWFLHDLRVQDNAALSALSNEVDQCLCVYFVSPHWFTSNQYDMTNMGKHRYRFTIESLQELQRELEAMGQHLHVIYQDPVQGLPELIEQHAATHVGHMDYPGTYEQQNIGKIKTSCPHVNFIMHDHNTLYDEAQLPFSLDAMPDVFSPFRRKVEKYAGDITAPLTIKTLASPITQASTWDDALPQVNNIDQHAVVKYLQGGCRSAKQQLNYYIHENQLLASYKETRNGLDGWDFSSKLSAWLANGCVSPRQVNAEIKRFEAEIVANDSTYWLFFELLWREFFHWQLYKYGSMMFEATGIQDKQPTGRHDRRRFERWCHGNTGYAIVDAAMNQLNATGFLSNRTRQLVASCFIHELGLHWRYGAAYFEQQLVDFDVASNWGNWQYLAGVGSDPRGLRQFNLNKQTEIYDPQRTFIEQWT